MTAVMIETIAYSEDNNPHKFLTTRMLAAVASRAKEKIIALKGTRYSEQNDNSNDLSQSLCQAKAILGVLLDWWQQQRIDSNPKSLYHTATP